jgi:CheY-like chemotaxis protein
MNTKKMEVPGTAKKKVLIVEDDADNAFMTENTLRNYFETTTVKNGFEALEAVEEDQYDAVLMDINLGDINMDGIKTQKLIKLSGKHKKLKIFAMTEISKAREWYIINGFEDLFAKPILYRKIISVINNSIDGNKESESFFLKAV